MNLIVVIPFCAKDVDRVRTLLDWIEELGGCPENDLLFVAQRDHVINGDLPFLNVRTINPPFELADERHPIGPNWMFETTLKYFSRNVETRPFLWMEPDAIPLKKGWLQEIEAEYAVALKRGKSILAHVIELNDPKYPKQIPSGVAVYPATAWKDFYGKLQHNRKVAWDIQFANAVMPHVYSSRKIGNRLNRRMVPTFVESRKPNSPPNAMTLGDLPRGAALWHPCKDGTLIGVIKARITPSAMQILTGWRENKNAPLILDTEDQPKPQRPRYIHVVERHAYVKKEDDERILQAFNSWVEVYKLGRMIPCHVWDTPRNSGEIGDDRKLPYLKDLFVEGMTKARENDIIVWTNDDTILHRRIVSALDTIMAKVHACGSMRLNFEKGDVPDLALPINDVLKRGKIDLGRDLFAFRKSWLKKYWTRIPDFFVGELEFDIVLTVLIRQSAGTLSDRRNIEDPCEVCEIPRGYVMHQKHERAWVSPKYAESPSKMHNRKLSVQFYSRHSMPSMIPTF